MNNPSYRRSRRLSALLGILGFSLLLSCFGCYGHWHDDHHDDHHDDDHHDGH